MIAWILMGRAHHVLVAVSCLFGARTAWAECQPTAVPSGDASLVLRLTERLTASGIATTSTSGCPAAKVRLEQRGDQIQLEVTDSFGRVGKRDVQDLTTAATIVESWTLQEIEEGAMPPLAEVPAPTDAPSPVVARAPARTVTLGLVAAAESSLADDGSLWLGATVSGCVPIGAVCVGALLRGTRDTGAAGSASTMKHDTNELQTLATVGLPRRLGSFVVTPAIALGWGWQQLAEHHLDVHMMPFDMEYSSHALRAGAQIAATRRIGRWLAIHAELSGDTAVARTAIPYGPSSAIRFSMGLRLGAE